MTDRERLIELLERFGIGWTTQELPDVGTVAVRVEAYDGDRNVGYYGFFTAFEFTPDGEFIAMGAWE